MRFLKWCERNSIPAVLLMVALVTAAFGCVLLGATTYAQGNGIGTLPRRTPALSAWQTLRLDSDSGGTYLLASTHDSEERLAPEGGAQSMSFTWRWHHTTLTLNTPRWVGETEDHWRTRAADAVSAMQLRFPPDDTLGFRLIRGAPSDRYRTRAA